jgi:hypothetical protein
MMLATRVILHLPTPYRAPESARQPAEASLPATRASARFSREIGARAGGLVATIALAAGRVGSEMFWLPDLWRTQLRYVHSPCGSCPKEFWGHQSSLSANLQTRTGELLGHVMAATSAARLGLSSTCFSVQVLDGSDPPARYLMT